MPGAAAGDIAPWFVAQVQFHVIAGTGYLLGITVEGIRRAEWYADLWLTVVWVTYFLVSGHHHAAQEPHIYVANWFYLFILTIAVLHSATTPAVPVSIYSPKSYVVWAGVQERWCSGGTGTMRSVSSSPPAFAIMYYYPERADGRIYSYRLDHPLLALIFHICRSSSLHSRRCRTGRNPRHDVLHHAVDAVVGRDDQRNRTPAWTSCAPTRSWHAWRVGRLTAWPLRRLLMSVKAVNSLSHYTD